MILASKYGGIYFICTRRGGRESFFFSSSQQLRFVCLLVQQIFLTDSTKPILNIYLEFIKLHGLCSKVIVLQHTFEAIKPLKVCASSVCLVFTAVHYMGTYCITKTIYSTHNA